MFASKIITLDLTIDKSWLNFNVYIKHLIVWSSKNTENKICKDLQRQQKDKDFAFMKYAVWNCKKSRFIKEQESKGYFSKVFFFQYHGKPNLFMGTYKKVKNNQSL